MPKPFFQQAKRRFETVFSIDPRSLGLFRIAFGLTLVLDLVEQSAILEEMTTDLGSLPRELHAQIFSPVERWSIHMLDGSFAFQAFLCGLTFAALSAFILGYHTRWATLILWVLLVSLRNRHPLFDTASDGVRRMMLFWGFFLPLGCRFSLDRWAGRQDAPARPLFSIATVAILLQILMIYVGAGLPKEYDTWVRQGTATIMALRLDMFATEFGKALLDYPELLKVTSASTWMLEIIGPILLLSPFYNSYVRLAGVAAFISLHIGLLLCLHLGAFPHLMIAVWLIFLPPVFWSWLSKLPGRPGFIGRMSSRVEELMTAAATRRRGAGEGSVRRSWVNGYVAKTFVTLCLAMVIIWNIQRTGKHMRQDFPDLIRSEEVVKAMNVLRLTQYWNVFSPYPFRKDAWPMLVATLKDGSKVELLTGGPVRWTKPERVSDVFRNDRWRKYANNVGIRNIGWRHYRNWAGMHARRWNAENPESRHVKKVEFIRMIEMLLPDLTEAPVQTFRIWQGDF